MTEVTASCRPTVKDAEYNKQEMINEYVNTLVYTTYVAYNEITIIKFSEFRNERSNVYHGL